MSETKESEKYKFVFGNRLKNLQKSYNMLLSLLPEVEIDYGLEMKILCNELKKHITDYHFNINQYLQLVDNWDLENNPNHKNLNSIILNNSEDNPTTDSFNDTVEKLEKQLKKEIKKY